MPKLKLAVASQNLDSLLSNSKGGFRQHADALLLRSSEDSAFEYNTAFEFWAEFSLTHSCGKPGLRHRAVGKVDAEERKKEKKSEKGVKERHEKRSLHN